MTRHALTIDVENWYHAENMRPVAPADRWSGLASHLRGNVDRLLELFSRRGVRATFFVLGSAAEREPAVVRAIADAGHEVACHGWSHQLIYRQTPEEFRDETRRAKRFLEDLSGQPVTGYRASTFSIVEKTLWALDVLAEEGFSYDSSIAPVSHDRYGIPSAPVAPHVRDLEDERRIVEFPVSFGSLLSKRFPVGGGFFRLFPRRWTRNALNACAADGRPGTLYLHPWEVDPDPPRPRGLPFFNRFRHYARIAATRDKLDRLLGEVPFTTMAEVLRSIPGLETNRAPTG